ncbi:PD-(D/E)XK motif protein [Halopseudomonas sp.]|uniref:PD-(D/E)XK motif protein n=1 Tax=Halopseudomonas sp. TaxID=2901191 RepID=UPI0030012FFC
MAQVNESVVLGIWKALRDDASHIGWRVIDLMEVGPCRIKVGRYTPGNQEAILIGFSSIKTASLSHLPHGKGFRMEKVELGGYSDGHQWLAVVRQPAGSLELFATVAADIARFLGFSKSQSEQLLYQQFLGRVRSWQEFMQKGREGLSPEAELGLVGELFFLELLHGEGPMLNTIIEAWKGPFHGLHDFELGYGAIEVKATLAKEGFPIRIMSLDQLDDSQHAPLYLIGMRFSVSGTGLTLPALVDRLRSSYISDTSALQIFEDALLAAGYLDLHENLYTRSFSLKETRLYLVDSEFPRLTPFNLSPAIRRAQYEVDLSIISLPNITLQSALGALGVL